MVFWVFLSAIMQGKKEFPTVIQKVIHLFCKKDVEKPVEKVDNFER